MNNENSIFMVIDEKALLRFEEPIVSKAIAHIAKTKEEAINFVKEYIEEKQGKRVRSVIQEKDGSSYTEMAFDSIDNSDVDDYGEEHHLLTVCQDKMIGENEYKLVPCVF